MMSLSLYVLVSIALIGMTGAFHTAAFRSARVNAVVTEQYLFGRKAAPAAGADSGKVTTPLVAGSKRVEAAPGSSMLAATKKLGLKVPLDCKKGDCGACTVTVGGKKIRACVGKVPEAPKLKSLREKGLVVTVDNK
jgi:ferredoxin